MGQPYVYEERLAGYLAGNAALWPLEHDGRVEPHGVFPPDASSAPVPFSGSRPCFFMVSAVFLSRMDIFSFLRFASISEILAAVLFPVSFGR
ncbi:MAG: hypothetical protein II160_05665, partial [Selenomonas sp.]|nr:hypothetical protein [Selenomonas sp.]